MYVAKLKAYHFTFNIDFNIVFLTLVLNMSSNTLQKQKTGLLEKGQTF